MKRYKDRNKKAYVVTKATHKPVSKTLEIVDIKIPRELLDAQIREFKGDITYIPSQNIGKVKKPVNYKKGANRKAHYSTLAKEVL